MSVRVCANEFCVYLKHNDMPWEQFIWLKIKGVQGVSLSVKILKSTEEFSFFIFFYHEFSTLTVHLMMLE